MKSTRHISRRGQITLAFLFVLLCTLFATSDLVRGQSINLFDKKKKSAPPTPRPKTDEAITKTLRDGLQDDFSPGSMRTNIIILFFVFSFGGIVAGLVYYDFKRRQRISDSYESPDALFGDLCTAHELTKSESRFLHTLADDLDLENPLPLFVEPKHLQNAFRIEKYQSSSLMLHYFLEKLFDIESEPIDEGPTTLIGSRSRTGNFRSGGTSIYRPHR